MIFQDPMTSLNPVLKIGDQIMEQIQEHEGLPDQQARERTIELLDRVGIPRARDRVDNYPFEFSGGMRQRVMIALALSCNPSRADRRRAHHGAGRDHPGPDPRAHPRPARGDRRRRDPRDPRPRRGGGHRRPHRGDVRRAASSSRARSTRSSMTRSTPTRGACWARSPGWTSRARSAFPPSPACRRRSPDGRRAVTSVPAARTSSGSAPRCRRSSRASRMIRDTRIAAGCRREEKRVQARGRAGRDRSARRGPA